MPSKIINSPIFTAVHLDNPYQHPYNFTKYIETYEPLKKHVVLNPSDQETIHFSDSNAVYALNKAILLADYSLEDYVLPKGYLIPPVPGRLDYLLYLKDFLSERFNLNSDKPLKGLDMGSGANAIYCILGAQHFGWSMVGAESDAKAVEIAKKNIQRSKALNDRIEIRLQENKQFLFKHMIQPNDSFDFSVCNPPFHSSKEEALKGSIKKHRNLGSGLNSSSELLNFEGQANELWCNGGEALFIKRLIKESLVFKKQVKVFSSLISKTESITIIEKSLKKAGANHLFIPMEIGNKMSRIVVWWF